MTSINYEVLIPDVNVAVPSCPGPTILRALQKSAREFFRLSESYVHAITPVVVTEAEVTLTLPLNTELLRPLDMTFAGRALDYITQDQATLRFGNWADPMQAVSRPRHIMNTSGTKLALVPMAQAGAGELRGTVALRPTRMALTLVDTQMDAAGDYIVYGAIASLMAIPGTNWYKPDAVGYYQSRFERGVMAAKQLSRGHHVESAGVVVYGGI